MGWDFDLCPGKKHENGAFWLPLTTTPSPLSLPSSHPALPLLRCLFLLQSLANVAVRCNLVFPHSSVLLLNGKAWWNLSLSPIPHNIFLSYLISSIFCKNYPPYFLHVDTLICTVYSSLLLCIIFAPPFYIIMFEVVTCSHFLILGHSDTILGRGMRLSYSASSVYIQYAGLEAFKGVCSLLERPRESDSHRKWSLHHCTGICLQCWWRIITSAYQLFKGIVHEEDISCVKFPVLYTN